MLWPRSVPRPESGRWARFKTFLFGTREAAKDSTVLPFKGLLRESFKRSFSRGWLLFGTLGTFMPDLIVLIQRYGRSASEQASSIGWVADYQSELRVGIAVIVIILYLIYAPYRIQKDKLKSALGDISKAKFQLKELAEAGSNKAHDCFKKAAELLKSGDEDFPFRALCKADVHLLERNDLVIEACNHLMAYEYDDPFAGLDEYVPEADRHAFLKWLHFSQRFDGRKGTDYLLAAEAWRVKHGYPTPSATASLSLLFSKVLSNVPPLDRKKLKRGLKVSVFGVGIEDLEKVRFNANVMFVNDGPTQRTVFGVSFSYQYPTGDLADGKFPVKAIRQDGDSNATIILNSNTELSVKYQGTFPPTLFKRDGATIDILITVSDGDGHVRAKMIPAVTIKEPPKEGGVRYSHKGAHPISMDEEPFMRL